MPRLSVKTTVLFEPGQYRELKRKAAAVGKPLGELVRVAVAQVYGLGSPADRLAAVERLARLEAPVGEWSEMEAEILRGALG